MTNSFFIFLNKLPGISSQHCLTEFKRKSGIKKIGHHGTLDPFATGLLLVGVNEATKFFRFVDDAKKTYEATLKFGERTDTLDKDGKIIETLAVPDLSPEQILQALAALTGKIKQTPPMYSAIKIDGEKLYELARKGIEVERAARDVEIFSLELLSWQTPFLKFRAKVSRGTYIRTLAEQIAEKFGTIAHLTELCRTELNGFDLSRQDKEIAIPELFSFHERIDLDESQFRDLYHGKLLPLLRGSEVPDKGKVAPRAGEGSFLSAYHKSQFLGVVTQTPQGLKAERLMSEPHPLPKNKKPSSFTAT